MSAIDILANVCITQPNTNTSMAENIISESAVAISVSSEPTVIMTESVSFNSPEDISRLPGDDKHSLAVAILDTLWPSVADPVVPNKVLTREAGRTQLETQSPLWNLMWLWLTDKHGKNILYSPDGSERYPQFDLYCAIAKDAQNAVPAQQLTLPLFDSAFRCRRKDIPAEATLWRLSALGSKSTSSHVH
jgi:hypothetical protein